MKEIVKQNKLIIFFFLITIVSGFIMLSLSFNGMWNIMHGPLYFSYAEGFIEYGELKSLMYAIPRDRDVFTIQVGVTYFLIPSILIFGKNLWFIFFIPTVSVLWIFAYLEARKFLKKINYINNLDVFLIFTLIFLQPYNLNTIAAFSNYSVYLPMLIYAFFKFLYLIEQKEIKYNLSFLIFLLILYFGVFFRLHHGVFLFSMVITLFVIKNYSYFRVSVIIFISIVFFAVIILFNTHLVNALGFINSFLDTVFNSLKIEKIEEFNENNKFYYPGQGEFWIEKIVRFLEPYCFFLFLPKFIDTGVVSVLIHFTFFLIFIYILKTNLETYGAKNFLILSIFFILGSSIFLFMLPMFELNYLLASNWLVIFNYYLFLKKKLNNLMYKLIPVGIVTGSIILLIFYSGIFSSKLIETPDYRVWLEKLRQNSKNIDENTLVYFNTPTPSIPEMWYWFLNKRFCNFNLAPSECAKILNIENISKVYVIKREKSLNLKNNINKIMEKHSFFQTEENLNYKIFSKM
jgi:hypothetical protein